MIEFIKAITPLAWPALVIFVLYRFKAFIQQLLTAILKRIDDGCAVETPLVKIGESLKSLDKVPPQSRTGELLKSLDNVLLQSTLSETKNDLDWSGERDGIYKNSEGFFLAHVTSPIDSTGNYDAFIYLVQHKPNIGTPSQSWTDIDFVEFFLGKQWGNRVFRETLKDGRIGISTTAYSPFLCTCRLKMKNGNVIRLHRYIDFEMAILIEESESTS